ncbi:hypothetical protein QYF52_15575 [Paenibacillus polymyxa]|nr:hypothetical protein [Paenibacillus polymyxa]MDN4079367.1 hypothetical protein [Paenibacillus polymyxa]MDN4104788.1 hypothetical protein [Paenibacillus polymyxa]MDN4115175.1 hypothetical protein [Paenibacillus polymyxa]
MIKEKFDYCPKNHYHNKIIEKGLTEELLDQVRIKKNEAQHKIKKVKGIGELLNIHIQIPDIEVNRNLEFIETQECKLNPSGCKSSYEIAQKYAQVLHVELNKEIGILNSMADVIEHLRELHKEKGYPRDVYYRLFFDRDDHMTCVYFDLSNYDPDHLAILYLSFGKTPMNYRSRMYLKHTNADVGILKIVDFFSIEENKGHGAFMLESLVDLIPLLNQKIERRNQEYFNELSVAWSDFQDSCLLKKTIEDIIGSIYAPPNLYERLVRFYKRNNFYKEGSVYRKI